MANSGLTIEELWRVYSGQWAGFNRDWLRGEIVAQPSGSPSAQEILDAVSSHSLHHPRPDASSLEEAGRSRPEPEE